MDVIATAMVSSLGYDVHTACAAARAGLVRRVELPFTILEDDASPGLASGHPTSLLGGGFEGDGRLIRLLEGAFRDLMSQSAVDFRSISKILFYVAIPGSDRERQGLDLIADDDERADYLERLGESAPVDEIARAVKIVQTAIRIAGFPIKVPVSVSTLRASVSGHTAVVELYQAAQNDLQSGRVELAIVAAVDSLVTNRTLNWLHLTHRLKGAESPAGVSPGEAAALVVLRNGPRNGAAPPPPLARIDHVASATSSTAFLSQQPPDGKGQFEIVRTLTRALGAPEGRAWFVVDQNGEVFRANDWGCSLVRLQGAGAPTGDHTDVWYPVASFGDVGAASGAVATCMVASAFERGYAPSRRAFVLTSSDGAQRAGCVVSAMED